MIRYGDEDSEIQEFLRMDPYAYSIEDECEDMMMKTIMTQYDDGSR